MRRSNSLLAVCLVGSLVAIASAEAQEFKPAPGCPERWSEVAALEASLKGERKIPYDHKENPSRTLFAPVVEGGVGITHVGMTMVFVAEFQGRGQSCGKLKLPEVNQNYDMRICTSL